jgi:hypothetical protein
VFEGWGVGVVGGWVGGGGVILFSKETSNFDKNL